MLFSIVKVVDMNYRSLRPWTIAVTVYCDTIGVGYVGCACSIQTFTDGAEAHMVDCSANMAGQVLDHCPSSEPVVGMLEYWSFKHCIDLSTNNDICS